MVLSTLLTLSVTELAVVILALAWASSTTMVSILQLHTNADSLAEWDGALSRRRAAATVAHDIEDEFGGFVNASRDAVHSRQRFLKRRIDAAAKEKAQLTRDLADPDRLVKLRKKRKGHEQAGADTAAESDKDKWLRLAKQRVMRVGCPRHRDAEARFSELLEQLGSKLEVSDAAAYRSGKGQLDSHEAEMIELEGTARRAEAAVQHMEAKMASIAALWPQWFEELNGDAPVYRGLFRKDAKLFPTHDAGLREYMQRTGRYQQHSKGSDDQPPADDGAG